MKDDTISRQAVIELVQKYHGKMPNEINHQMWKEVKALPPAQPEPKIGHWIDDKCSVCGKGTEDLISSREWYRNEEPNFCPFCGLKLVDSQESEE